MVLLGPSMAAGLLSDHHQNISLTIKNWQKNNIYLLIIEVSQKLTSLAMRIRFAFS
jgi:hypothetical protein